MPAFKLHLPDFANGLRWRSGSAPGVAIEEPAIEPLPPILALEGMPDPSLRSVINQVARRLGASVCQIESLAALKHDPDLESVVAVVLARPRSPLELYRAVLEARELPGGSPVALVAPQASSPSLSRALPVDASIVAPPISVDRLLLALGFSPAPVA